MVLFVAIATILVPLAMAGSIGYGQQQMPSNWQNSRWQDMGWKNWEWWGMTNEDDYEAYLRWCEERRLAIQEQEAQQSLLKEIEERAEEKKAEMEHEKVMREQRVRRESMMAQWRMWQAQLAQADEFDGMIERSFEMKVHYMFSLTMEFLKFCRCADDTAHLQRYLIHDGMTYEPGVNDAFNLDDLEGVDPTDVDAVAARMATLSQEAQIKLFFGGIIDSMCGSVKTYVAQVRTWENQYNFLGHW
nr:hypothetical protein BaRGS_033492 [Batillaria attramentaria]